MSCLCVCQSVMNMMHVISIPYALMKVNPLSWIQKVCQYKGRWQTTEGGREGGSQPCLAVSSLLIEHIWMRFVF